MGTNNQKKARKEYEEKMKAYVEKEYADKTEVICFNCSEYDTKRCKCYNEKSRNKYQFMGYSDKCSDFINKHNLNA